MEGSSSRHLSGYLFGIAAFSLFAIMPLYLQWLEPLSGYTVLCQRILWSCIILIFALGISGKLPTHLQPLKSIKAWPGLLAGSVLIGFQWGVFVWAPLNGQTLDLSLGYFLMPIFMVLIGRLFLNEKLRPLQWAAIVFSVLGVALAYLNSNGLSWVVVIIVVGYPLYLTLRRYQSLPTFSAFLLENLILLPFAIVGLMVFGDLDGSSLSQPFDYELNWTLLFLGVAVLGSIPMLCFIAANNRLPMSSLGLLSYLEPTLIFLAAYIILGEKVKDHELLIYIPVAIALMLTLIDGLLLQAQKKG
jgi:chloramphenicol-sensitive protein RarD